MTRAKELPFVRFISNEAPGMGTDHLEGPDAGLLTYQVNGPQRDLSAHFPSVPALASDHEVAGDAHRKAFNGRHAAEAVLPGTSAKGV